jgi:hypothetical protein
MTNAKVLIMAFALVASGCGGTFGQGNAYYTCSTDTHFSEIIYDGTLRCDTFKYNEDLAFKMLADVGLVPPGSEHDFSGLTVHVKSVPLYETVFGTADGNYDAMAQLINLGSHGLALIHEMIHHWQTIHGSIDTMFHTGWCENGYGGPVAGDCPGSLSDIYSSTARDMGSNL